MRDESIYVCMQSVSVSAEAVKMQLFSSQLAANLMHSGLFFQNMNFNLLHLTSPLSSAGTVVTMNMLFTSLEQGAWFKHICLVYLWWLQEGNHQTQTGLCRRIMMQCFKNLQLLGIFCLPKTFKKNYQFLTLRTFLYPEVFVCHCGC